MDDLVPQDIILLLFILMSVALGLTTFVLLLVRGRAPVVGVGRADRIGAAFIGGGASFVGVIAVGLGIGTILTWFGSTEAFVPNMGRQVAVDASDVTPLAHVVSATSTAVDVDIADAPLPIRVWMWMADFLPIVTTIVVCVLAVWLAMSLRRGRPFARRFPVALVILACTVMVCGVGALASAGFARAETAAFLNAEAGGDGIFMTLNVGLDLSPLGWGLLIGLLAGAFQIGARMQKDTEGLV